MDAVESLCHEFGLAGRMSDDQYREFMDRVRTLIAAERADAAMKTRQELIPLEEAKRLAKLMFSPLTPEKEQEILDAYGAVPAGQIIENTFAR